MCVKHSGLVFHVAVAKASLAGGNRIFQTTIIPACYRVLLYKVTTAITIVTVTIYRVPKPRLTAPIGKLRKLILEKVLLITFPTRYHVVTVDGKDCLVIPTIWEQKFYDIIIIYLIISKSLFLYTWLCNN